MVWVHDFFICDALPCLPLVLLMPVLLVVVLVVLVVVLPGIHGQLLLARAASLWCCWLPLRLWSRGRGRGRDGGRTEMPLLLFPDIVVLQGLRMGAGDHASGRAEQHFDKLRCSCPIWHSLNFKVLPRV